jgi:hypothetical protein
MGFIQVPQKKRIKVKLANTKRLREARKNHKDWLESQGLDDKTLRNRTKNFKGYEIPKYEPDPNVPKCSDKIPVGTGGKKEQMQYSGKRRLIGIGLMHKSNLVPIWDEEGAKEISTMRRN